jgi:hypothetical protein
VQEKVENPDKSACRETRQALQSVEKPRWFFNAWEEALRGPENLRIFRAAR